MSVRLAVTLLITTLITAGGCSPSSTPAGPAPGTPQAGTLPAAGQPAANPIAAVAPSAAGATQASGTAAKAAAGKIDVSYIHDGFAGALIMHPRRILDSPLLKILPPEQFDQMFGNMLRGLPFDPHDVDQILFVAGPPTLGGDPAEAATTAAIMQFQKPIEEALVAKMLGPKTEPAEFAGKKYIRGVRPKPFPSEGIYKINEKTIIVGPEKDLQKMLASEKGSGRLAELLSKVDGDHDLVAAGVLAPVKEMLSKGAEMAKRNLPPPLQVMAAIPDHLKTAVLTADLQGKYLVKLSMEGNDEDGANALNSYAIVGRDFVKSMLAAARPNFEHGAPPEFAKPVLKLIDDLLAGLKITPEGTHVMVSLKTPPGWADLPKTLAPGIAAARKKAEEMQHGINLRQVFYAMLSYESAYDHFPPAAVLDKNGKPLLSWRVLTMPYIELGSLFRSMHLDEPWDSANNRHAISYLSPIYGKNREKGLTSIFVFTGEGTPFGQKEGPTKSSLKNGASKTIMAVEAGEDKAVPWTKPVDLTFDRKNPAAALGTLPDGKFWAVFFDGHVEKLDAKMDPAKLLSMILADGGAAGKEGPAAVPGKATSSISEPKVPAATSTTIVPPKAAELPLRTWSDQSGKQHVEARFIAVEGDSVRLKKADGNTVVVPLSKLSTGDQDYAKQNAATRKP